MFRKTILSVITILLIAIALVDGVSSARHETGDRAEEGFEPARVREAYTARWVALGESYNKVTEAQRE